MTADTGWFRARVYQSEARDRPQLSYVLTKLRLDSEPHVGRVMFFVLTRRHPLWDKWLEAFGVVQFVGITNEFIAADVLNREVDVLVRDDTRSPLRYCVAAVRRAK